MADRENDVVVKDRPAKSKFPSIPPRGFGHSGDFEELPEAHRDALQGEWNGMTETQKVKMMDRTAHHRYDHAAFLRESA
jgi:hypothetical protein